LEKLKTIDSTLKVWVGGLKKNVSWKDLEKHFVTIAKPSLTHINEKNGSGVVCFKNEDDVSTAIASLNGTSLKGSAIEVDAWVRPEREKKDKSEKKEKPKVKE
jgi:RNA recognition motif-containing protein